VKDDLPLAFALGVGGADSALMDAAGESSRSRMNGSSVAETISNRKSLIISFELNVTQIPSAIVWHLVSYLGPLSRS
jgi:hypothetical protein